MIAVLVAGVATALAAADPAMPPVLACPCGIECGCPTADGRPKCVRNCGCREYHVPFPGETPRYRPVHPLRSTRHRTRLIDPKAPWPATAD